MTTSPPPINIPELLRQHGLRPDKRLGQNYLIDHGFIKRIVDLAEISSQDSVLEIGAGVGNLTRFLALSARRVIAVEIDGRVLPVLNQVLASFNNIEIIHADVLQIDPAGLFQQEAHPDGYLVVANIPYYITSALIRHLLEAPLKPKRMILTVQREVAERICASPGDLSLLALSIQVYGAPRMALHIPAGAFYPPPEVDSAVVCIELYSHPQIEIPLLDTFFKLSKAGFSQKRKTLRNSLSAGLHRSTNNTESLLRQANIDPQRRAETLTLEEWQQLCQAYVRLSPQDPSSS
jgi:16S rRNA (adenine1518-N6/adenine1519-N6)-dimethyltransferase